MIRASFRNLLINLTSLEQIHEEVIKFFADIRKKHRKIGYVAGIITSDGPGKIELNRKRLIEYTDRLEGLYDYPLFSAVDIFSDEIYDRIEEKKLDADTRERKFAKFWGGVIRSGHLTDIFMTPGWQRSKGATIEHNTAKEIGLKIHYYENIVQAVPRTSSSSI